MPNKPPAPRAPDTLSFRIGRWVEASATGWGLATLVLLAVLLSAVALVAGPGLLAQ